MRVTLLPIGPVPRDLLTWLSDALASCGIVCHHQAEAPLPPEAFDANRRQFRAELLLQATGAAERTLAVTAGDLYAEGLNFVFGLADAGGPRALVSVHRLGEAKDPRLRERVLKESVHELGHTLGLAHCEDPGCVMSFSNTLAHADAKGSDFCEACRAKLPVTVGRRR